MRMQNLLSDDILQALSEARLSTYIKSRECQIISDPLATYYWNVQLSEALYPALQALEVVLRNALHNALFHDFRTENWIDLPFLYPKEQEAIRQAKTSLLKQKKPLEINRIVAELHFGFWTSLFDVRYEHKQTIWPRLLINIFPNIPKPLRTRQYLSKQLNRIRRLRNRVFHYEPIWHWHDLKQQHQSIIFLLNWLSPAVAKHIRKLDRFLEVYDQNFSSNFSSFNNQSYIEVQANKGTEEIMYHIKNVMFRPY